MIHRELKASLERHKVFRCCIEFQTGFPPTKTKKLLKYGWHFKHIHPRNYKLLLHAALNPFLLSSVSMKGGYKEKVRSRNIDGGVNHPTSVIKRETSCVHKRQMWKDWKTNLLNSENRRGVSSSGHIEDDMVDLWQLIGPYRSGIHGAIDQQRQWEKEPVFGFPTSLLFLVDCANELEGRRKISAS